MAESQSNPSGSPAASGSGAPRKRAASRKKSAATSRKAAKRRRKTPSARSRKSPLEGFLKGLAQKAAKASSSLAAASGQGIEQARRAIGKAGAASKKTIDRLTKEWQQMDAKRRIQFVAALLGALAAASAPVVRSRFRKK